MDTPEPVFNHDNTEPFGRPRVTVTTTEFPPRVGYNHPDVTQNFVDVILGKDENKWDGRSGLGSLELANAMILSAWEGNKEITLPMDSERYYALLEEKIGKK